MFDGGDGLVSGGREDRSMESGVRATLDFGLDDGETGGEALCASMIQKDKISLKGKSDQ